MRKEGLIMAPGFSPSWQGRYVRGLSACWWEYALRLFTPQQTRKQNEHQESGASQVHLSEDCHSDLFTLAKPLFTPTTKAFQNNATS